MEVEGREPLLDADGLERLRRAVRRTALVVAGCLILAVALASTTFDPRDDHISSNPEVLVYSHFRGEAVSDLHCRRSAGSRLSTCTFVVDGLRCSANVSDSDFGLNPDRCRRGR
jgi:hypothetical protein